MRTSLVSADCFRNPTTHLPQVTFAARHDGDEQSLTLRYRSPSRNIEVPLGPFATVAAGADDAVVDQEERLLMPILHTRLGFAFLFLFIIFKFGKRVREGPLSDKQSIFDSAPRQTAVSAHRHSFLLHHPQEYEQSKMGRDLPFRGMILSISIA